MTIVIKRDGSKAPFNKARIESAVIKANEYNEQGVEVYARNVSLAVELKINSKFERDLYDPSLDWRGSSNQVIHRFDKRISEE